MRSVRLAHLGAARAADPLGDDRDAEPGPARAGDVADGCEERVAPDLLGLAVERGGVADAAGQDAVGDDPHRHVAHHPVLGQATTGGLEAHEPVDRSRDPDRAAAVVGVRDRHRSGGDEGGGARGRGAGVVVGAPRGADRPEAHVVGGAGEAELRELRLAERDEPGGEVHPGEVAVGRLRLGAERVGAVLGRHAGDVHVVLDERGHAREPAAAWVPGLLPGAVVGGVRNGAEGGVDLLGAGDRSLDDLRHRHEPGSERLDEARGVEVGEGVVGGEGVHARHGRAAYGLAATCGRGNRWPLPARLRQRGGMTSSDYWDAETAATYDESSAFMFAPEVLDPTVDFLAALAGDGAHSRWPSAPDASRSPWPSEASGSPASSCRSR